MPNTRSQRKVSGSKRSVIQAQQTDEEVDVNVKGESKPTEIAEAEEETVVTEAEVKVEDESDQVQSSNKKSQFSSNLADEFAAHLAAVGSGLLMKEPVRIRLGSSINKVDTWEASILNDTSNLKEDQKIQIEINHAVRPVLLRSQVGAVLKLHTYNLKGNIISVAPSNQIMIESADESTHESSASSNRYNAEEVLECVNFSMLSWKVFRDRYKKIAIEVDANNDRLRKTGYRGPKKTPIAISLVGLVKDTTVESGPNNAWNALNLQLCDSSGFVNLRIYSSNEEYGRLSSFDQRTQLKHKIVRCDGCYFGQIDPKKLDQVHASNIRMTMSMHGTCTVVTGQTDARAKAIETDIENAEQTLEEYLLYKQPIAVGFRATKKE